MEELYLPVLSHFQNGNIWTGSDRRLRYRLVPGEEGISAEAWEGPWSYQFSQVEERAEFPLDEAGLASLRAWIVHWSGVVNGRPPKSMAETIRERDALLAQREEPTNHEQ